MYRGTSTRMECRSFPNLNSQGDTWQCTFDLGILPLLVNELVSPKIITVEKRKTSVEGIIDLLIHCDGCSPRPHGWNELAQRPTLWVQHQIVRLLLLRVPKTRFPINPGMRMLSLQERGTLSSILRKVRELWPRKSQSLKTAATVGH